MPSVRHIVIRLQRPEQMFAPDPVSPTSPEYTEFTAQAAMDTVRDMLLMRMPPKDTDIELQVVLPAEHVREGLSEELTTAARRWLRVQNTMDVESTEADGAIGRRLFVFGVIAFLILQTLSQFVAHLGDRYDDLVVDAVAEGLNVTSWVMLWFPVQLFTVQAWRASIRRRRMRIMERLTVTALRASDLDGQPTRHRG